MSHNRAVLRYSPFTASAQGGNPAGVVIDARGLSDAEMLAIAGAENDPAR